MGDFMKNKRKICAALMLISFMPSFLATHTDAINITSAVNSVKQWAGNNTLLGKVVSCLGEKLETTTNSFTSSSNVNGTDNEIIMGICPDNGRDCVWTLNTTSGTLVFESSVFIINSMQIDNAQREFVEEGAIYGIIANGTKNIYNYPFRHLPNLKSVSLPDTVTEIGGFMENCPQIEELTFSGDCRLGQACSHCDGLKTINLGRLVSGSVASWWVSSALAYRCPNLISVNVDEGNLNYNSVKGSLLTKDWKKLSVYPFGRTSKAVIPHGVEETFEGTFVACPFMAVTIPGTVKTIHDAFDGCNNLSTINFFGTQEPAKSSKYNFCGSEVINVPHDYNGTTFWGYPVQKVIDHHGYLNDDCTYWMTQVDDTQMTIGGEGDLDSSLLANDGSTWNNVKDKIKKVVIDEGITTINMSIFSDCENLNEVNLPRSVKNVTSLSECPNLTSIIVPEDNKNFSAADGVLFSKNSTELIYYPSGKSSSSYKIPEGTTTICSDAFSDCKNLKEVTLPKSIDRVEADAFSENSSLETVNYMGKNPPNSNFTFENPPKVQVRTDYKGDELFGVNVSKVFEAGVHGEFSWLFGPENTLTVEGIGAIDGGINDGGNPWDKFKNSAKRLVIEEGITSLGTAAFYGYDFTEVKLPSTLEKIGWSAFDCCQHLTDVVLPSKVRSIGKEAFDGCKNLRSVTLNEGLEEIGKSAFRGCKNLKSITLPKSLKTMEKHVFDECYALAEIHVEDGNSAYYDVDGVLFSKPDLALVQYPAGKGGHYTVPQNVTKISDSAFCNAENLESITIQGSIDTIGRDAFYGCYNLKSVHVNGKVERIDDNAFAFCERLSEVEYEGQERPELGENVFFGCDKLNTTTI